MGQGQMKVLVTGGAGFIGSHLCDALVKRGNLVYSIDNYNDYYQTECLEGLRFENRKKQNIADALTHYNFVPVGANNYEKIPVCDITDAPELRKHWPPNVDVVVHLAARAGVRASLRNPDLYRRTNVEGTKNVIDAAAGFEVKRFVVASSSSVYGKNPHVPWNEDLSLDEPASPYAETKKEMEDICAGMKRLFATELDRDLKMTLLRFFTVYGPRGRPDMAPYKFSDLISRGEKIPKYGDGSTERDYTYVDDIVSGIIAAIDRPQPFEIINLGNNKPVTLNDFIGVVEATVGQKAKIKQMDVQKGDVPRTYADVSKAERLLGWKPTTNLEEGMKKFYEWYKANPEKPRSD